MGAQPDYIKCVIVGYKDSAVTWCGRKPDPFEWTFTDESHAILNARNGDRLLICKECAAAMKGCIDRGSEG